MIKMKEWLTIAELAERTKVPEPSVRRYLKAFGDFFNHKGGSRGKRYEDTAVKVLIRIKQLFEDGYQTDAIDGFLRKEFPMIISDDNMTDSENKAATPTLATVEDMEEIKQALAEQREFNKQQQEFNKVLIQKLSEQESYIKESLQKRDQKLIESMRQGLKEQQAVSEMIAASVQEKKKSTKRSFWQRLFDKGD